MWLLFGLLSAQPVAQSSWPAHLTIDGKRPRLNANGHIWAERRRGASLNINSITSPLAARREERVSVQTKVPFYRPDLGEPEIEEVVAALRSGWLTTGPRVKRFEEEFAAAVAAPHAVAMNSCTAALHLAVHALGLRPGDGVLVPAMTFAATAEVVRYEGGIPILVDCDPATLQHGSPSRGAHGVAAPVGEARWRACRGTCESSG